MLAYGQPPQEVPKNIRDQPLDGCTFWNIGRKMFFSINAKPDAIDQLTLGDQSLDRNRLVGHP